MITPYTAEWFEVRKGKATASRFAEAIAEPNKTKKEPAARRNYRTELVTERLTGISKEVYVTPALEWGTEQEPYAIEAWRERTNQWAIGLESGWVEHPDLAAGATPDAFVGEKGLLEIKCPTTPVHIEYLKGRELPEKYKPQVQGQLWITEREWCDFISFDPRMPKASQLMMQQVRRDDDYIDDLASKVIQFLKEVDEDVAFLQNYEAA